MKIIQINCVYGEGSTGKLVQLLHHHAIERGWKSIVLYGRGNTSEEKGTIRLGSNLYGKLNKVISKITGLMYGGCYLNTQKAIRIIQKEKPNVVHLHCLNGNFINIYKLVSWLNKNNIKTILTLHAEFMHTANCSHAFECNKWKTGCGNCPRWKIETGSILRDRTATSWTKMYKAFNNFHKLTVISVSPWLMERAKKSPILAEANHSVILNAVDTSIFTPCPSHPVIEQLKAQGNRIILHVTPGFNITPGHPKGGEYVVQLANRLHNDYPEWVIVIAGLVAHATSLPENIITLGRISNQKELASLYSGADVTLLTSKKETFSMVTAESLCCGTPVIGFKAGAPEMITIPEYSSFVEHGDILNLQATLKTHSHHKKSEIALKAQEKYSSITMCEQFFNLYTHPHL